MAKKKKEKKKEEENYKCQFCERENPKSKWINDVCPWCGEDYDAILAQEGDD